MEKQWISTPFEKYFARTIEDMKLLTQVNLDSFHHKYQISIAPMKFSLTNRLIDC